MPSDITSAYDIYACLKESFDNSVYIIRSKLTNKFFILKISPQSRREILFNEYTVYQTLHNDHCKNIPQVYGFFDQDNLCFLLEEHIDGNSLYDLKENGYSFTIESVLPIMLQLCDILSQLHHQTPPIIHRDLTPKNILMTKYV